MQGHLGHLNDESDQHCGLVTERHLSSHRQAVAAEPRPEMLHELLEPLMGLSSAPHLVAVVPFPCARCLEQDWCPNGLWQMKVCTAVPAQEGRDRQGRGVVGPGVAHVIVIFCLCQAGEWGMSVSLLPALAQNQQVMVLKSVGIHSP